MSAHVSGVPETGRDMDLHRDAVLGAVRTAMTQLAVKLTARVKENKLSGQVLNVRAGRLRRSINFRVEEQGGQIVGLVGTNVEYARIHEMGADMDERVRGHMRTIKQAWGKMLKGPLTIEVRSHMRHIKVPERSFLRSALAEMQGEVQPTIARAVEAVRVAGA